MTFKGSRQLLMSVYTLNFNNTDFGNNDHIIDIKTDQIQIMN